MINTICMLIFLIILTHQNVHSNKVITINTTAGSDSENCCVEGECPCSLLSTALRNLTSNTLINITSESVILHSKVTMGSGNITNVTIIGNGATIICHNTGSVQCNWCSDVTMKGITWDKCGNAHYNFSVPGVKFNTIANLSILNCTFQHSQAVAVYLLNTYENVFVDSCNFLSNERKGSLPSSFEVGGLYIVSRPNYTVNFAMHNNNFYNNGLIQNSFEYGPYSGYGLQIADTHSANSWNITISQTNFSCNIRPASMVISGLNNISLTLIEVIVVNNHNARDQSVFAIYVKSGNSNIFIAILCSNFSNNEGTTLFLSLSSRKNVTISMSNSNIIGNTVSDKMSSSMVYIDVNCFHFSFNLQSTQIVNNTINRITSNMLRDISGVLSIKSVAGSELVHKVDITMSELIVKSNSYFYERGGAVQITSHCFSNIIFRDCLFVNNTSVRGAAIYISEPNFRSLYTVSIINCSFDQNYADDSVIYIDVPFNVALNSNQVVLTDSCFTNNKGVSMFLSWCHVIIEGKVLFKNNIADKGGALFLNEASTIIFKDKAEIHFTDNSAVSHGGAIFVDLSYGCDQQHTVFNFLADCAQVFFTNTLPEYGGNSLYFSVSKYCVMNLNYTNKNSQMYIPYQFNYTQSINGTIISIPLTYHYTQLSITHFPVVTSPQSLKLYGNHIQFSNGTYFISRRVLGKAVEFNAIVLDYFYKPADTTEFHLQCIDCNQNGFSLLTTQLVIDNMSPLSLTLVGEEVTKKTNLTFSLFSHIILFHQQIEVVLIVEFVPCPNHPGFVYSTTSKGCICYHHDVVECYDDHNEIERNYWFGSINGKATTSLCPSEYCGFANRKKTREGYFELPDRCDDQCEHHRCGPSCGKCSPGYTLAYDSTKCISVDHCSAGMTILVVVLTCLYWIVIICGVFSLMYFNFQLSSGYLYGIIYYYSMVNILLSNNPYISSGVFQFISALSGFAQLAPKFLGELCLVEGLDGIDQLFIHYCHAGAVSVVLVLLIVTARYSRKISEFISHCVIRVFCLLLLLAYTSLVSTSLLLLRPLTFTDIDDAYTYSSPNIKYFHGKHVVYGSVALICELVMGIGLPLFLILSPFLIRQCPVRFIRVKALLDQFQGCYKDRYRWCAGYYLVCRQVLMLIVFIGNANYYHMVFYLEITCIIIAAIHMCLQPYRNKFLNIFDGFILQMMVFVVVISSFDFLQFATTKFALASVILPLPVLCISGVIKRVLYWRRQNYVAINDECDEDFDASDHDDLVRYCTKLYCFNMYNMKFIVVETTDLTLITILKDLFLKLQLIAIIIDDMLGLAYNISQNSKDPCYFLPNA